MCTYVHICIEVCVCARVCVCIQVSCIILYDISLYIDDKTVVVHRILRDWRQEKKDNNNNTGVKLYQLGYLQK